MARMMKVCPNCREWTSDNITTCKRCRQALITAQLTDMYWNTLSAEKKREYTHQYAGPTTEEKEAEERKLQIQKAEENRIMADNLRSHGMNGYYEYCVETVVDSYSGTNIGKLTNLLNARGREGWKLVSSHTNELGVNSISVGGLGTNSTVDETVLIFERFVSLTE